MQEALTNARRHAPGAAVDVELHYSGDALRAAGPRQRARPAPAAARHGRRARPAGMRERAATVGGELSRPAPRAGAAASWSRRLLPTKASEHRMSASARRGSSSSTTTRSCGPASPALLATQPDFTVVGTAADGAEAVRLCREQRPDVVLMDVRMPGMDGIEATRRLAAAAPSRRGS